MDLHDRFGQALGLARDLRQVIAAHRHDDVGRREGAGRGGKREGPVGSSRQARHGDALPDRRRDARGKVFDVADDVVLHHEAVGIRARIGKPREAALPVRRDEAEAVPPVGAPAVADPVLLQHDVVEATMFEEMADRQAGLPAADHGDGIVLGWRGDGVRHDGLYSSKASTSTPDPASRGWRLAAASISRNCPRASEHGKP